MRVIWESSSEDPTLSEATSTVDSWDTFDSQETVDLNRYSCGSKEQLLNKEELMMHIEKIEQQVEELKTLA